MNWQSTFEYPWMVIARSTAFHAWSICGFYKTLDEALGVYLRMGGKPNSSRHVKLCAR